MKIRDGIKLDFDDVLIVPQRSTIESRQDVSVEREFFFYHSPRKWVGTPIMSANMPPLASIKMAKELNKKKMICVLDKYKSESEIYNVIDYYDHSYVWLSIGMKDEDIDKIEGIKFSDPNLLSRYSPNIVVDVPNGHIEKFVKFCAKVRDCFPESIIAAGNVVTPEAVQELIIHGGVDIVKCGIGGGAQCKTRNVTGIGYPAISCIDECSRVAHGLKSGDRRMGLIMYDGGINEYNRVCKGYVAGADFLMIGTMLAGHDECDANWEYELVYHKNMDRVWVTKEFIGGESPYCSLSGKKRMVFYGLSSHYSQEKHGEGKKEYRASEGTVSHIENKGGVENTLNEILGGIRSCCAYIGATSIKDMSKCGEFVRVTR